MSTPTQNEPDLFAEFPRPTMAEWRQAAVDSLKGKPLAKLDSPRYEGFTLHPLMRAADIARLAYLQADPGQFPYSRGISAAGYQAQPWLVAQEILVADPVEFNAALRDALERGQTAVHLTCDAPTQAGQDPDQADPAHIGRSGLSIADRADLEAALAGVDLTAQPLLLQPGAAIRPLLALLAAHLDADQLPRLAGRLLYDPFATLFRTGALPNSLETSFDQLADLLRWRQSNTPRLHLLGAQGTAFHDAGADTVQELAFTLAGAVAMTRALLANGLTIADIAPHFSMELGIGGDFFMEVAKLRAARLLRAEVMAAFGADETGRRLFIHARSARRNKTVTDPHVNLLRVTTEAFAAVVGGANSLHLDPFDAVCGTTSPLSRRIARNVQLILQQEAGFTHLTDPGGGAYLVESLTDHIGRAAWTLFQEIEARGGMGTVCHTNFVRKQIQITAAARWTDFQSRKTVLVGTNRYPAPGKTELPTPDWDALAAGRITAVQERRREQNGDPAGSRSFPALINAARAGATLGQLSAGGVPVTGRPLTPYQPGRAVARLQEWAAAYEMQHGAPPTIFLANIGPLARHKARADFTREFFAVGGFAFVETDGFTDPEAAAAAIRGAATPLVAICGHNEDYPDFVPRFAQAVKTAVPAAFLILAGQPPEIETYRAAGVDQFIALGSNIIASNRSLQQQLTEGAHESA